MKKIQLRCCQSSGEPPEPPAKKMPSKLRSIISIVIAASITGPITSSSQEPIAAAQEKIGTPPPGHPRGAQVAQRRQQVDRDQDEAERRQAGRRGPGVDAVVGQEGELGERRQRVDAGLGRGEEEAGVEDGGAGDEEPDADLAEARQGGAAGADLQRRHVVEEAERKRQREEEDRGRAVEREHPVEGDRGEEGVLGDRQLQPHQQQLDQGDEEEAERAGDQDAAEVLVVGAGRDLDPARAARAGSRRRRARGCGDARSWRFPVFDQADDPVLGGLDVGFLLLR